MSKHADRVKDQHGRILEVDGEDVATLARSRITKQTKKTLKEDIKAVQDESAKKALKDIYHILTGEEIQ